MGRFTISNLELINVNSQIKAKVVVFAKRKTFANFWANAKIGFQSYKVRLIVI